MQALYSLPDSIAAAALEETKAPVPLLLVKMPAQMRANAIAARKTGDSLDMRGLIAGSQKLAQDVLRSMMQPLKRELSGKLLALDLSHNNMGPMAANIAAPLLQHLPHLTKLNIASNGIGATGFEMVVAYLHCLPLLEVRPHLRLRASSAGGAHALFQVLRTSFRHLSTCTCTQELDISSNKITGETMDEFGSEMHVVPKLTSLDISINNLGADGAASLFAHLSVCSALRRLAARHVGISGAAVPALITALPQLPSLAELDLASNKLKTADMDILVAGLGGAPALEVLTLHDTPVDQVVLRSLAAALAPNGKLRELDVGHVAGVGRGAGDDAPQAAFPTTLCSLNVNCRPARLQKPVQCVLDNEACDNPALLGLSMANLRLLETLDITGAHLEEQSLRNLLMRLLNVNDLTLHRVGVTDMQVTGDILAGLQGLTALRASRACRAAELQSEVTIETPAWLPDLVTLTRLCHLDLSGRGGENRADVSGLPGLTFLDLSHNPGLTGQGHLDLAASFGDLKALQHLNIADTGVDTEGVVAILNAIFALSALTHLNLSEPLPTAAAAAAAHRDALGTSVAKLTALRELIWRSAPPALLVSIGYYLAPLKALSKLDVEGTKLGEGGASVDLAWLSLLAESLTSLNLKSTCVFGGRDASDEQRLELFADLSAPLCALTNLRELVLSNNAYADVVSGESLLYEILSHMLQLRVLKLRGMGLTEASFVAFVPALELLGHLSELDLGRNDALTPGCIKLLSRKLTKTISVAILRLDGIDLPTHANMTVEDDDVVRRALGPCRSDSSSNGGRATPEVEEPALLQQGRGFLGARRALRGRGAP